MGARSGLFAMFCLVASYAQAQTYHLAASRDVGENQTLRILEDSRLTPAIAGKMWGLATDPAIVFGDDSPIVKKIGKASLLPAKLVLADKTNKVLTSLIPENTAPLARFMYEQLPGGAFLVSTDDSAGFGSYSGVRTQLLTAGGRKNGACFSDGRKWKTRSRDAVIDAQSAVAHFEQRRHSGSSSDQV